MSKTIEIPFAIGIFSVWWYEEYFNGNFAIDRYLYAELYRTIFFLQINRSKAFQLQNYFLPIQY